MTSASLLTLPEEILIEIVNAVGQSSKSRPFTELWDVDGALDAADSPSLSRLSKTCKFLHSIVQPILFRTVATSSKFVPLVRLLLEKPNLGALVRTLYVCGEWGFMGDADDDDEDEDDGNGDEDEDEDGDEDKKKPKSWHISPEDADLLSKAATRLSLTQEDQPVVMIEPLAADEDVNEINDESHNLFGLLSTLAIVHCPNVEQLSINVRGNELAAVGESISLDKLTCLTMSHGDTEGCTSFGHDVAWIFKAASNLKSIHGQSIGGFDDSIQNASLTEVVLTNSHLETESWENIINGFFNLERLTYWAGGATVSDEEEASPHYVVTALGRRKDTLKYLCVDWASSGLEYSDDAEPMQSMRHLHCLEEIDISESWLSGQPDTDGSYFIEFLPKSLRKLKFRKIASKWNFAHLINLIPDHFPGLKEVAITPSYYNHHQLEPELQARFQEKGVSYVESMV